MELRHIDAVMEIEQACFADPWSYTLFYQELNTEHGRSFVAVQEDMGTLPVAGYICSWVVHDECTINKIACVNTHRRKGIGRKLMEKLLGEGIVQGVRLFLLEVRESNREAQLFYEQFGFSQTGLRRGYYSDTGEHAVIMELAAAAAAMHLHRKEWQKEPFSEGISS